MLKKLPPISGLIATRDALAGERDELKRTLDALIKELDASARQRVALVNERNVLSYWAGPEPRYVPPGHFYSPIPSIELVRAEAERIFPPLPREIPGIDLNEEAQLRLLSLLERYYQDLPFGAEARPGLRYCFENPAYSYSDGVFLYCMLRHLRPKRIIEVGSGNSSCLILDVNDLHFGGTLQCTFIDPEPERFLSMISDGEREGVDLIRSPVQQIPVAAFRALGANDVLFIDSTHICKVGSDVNYLLFSVLPALRPGVHIHFHDVFFPFEYPKEWIFAGRAFNEAYALRAFLAFNNAFEIVLFNTFLEHFHSARFAARMPLCLNNIGGSIWLCKH